MLFHEIPDALDSPSQAFAFRSLGMFGLAG
jgi:hypothetical protein